MHYTIAYTLVYIYNFLCTGVNFLEPWPRLASIFGTSWVVAGRGPSEVSCSFSRAKQLKSFKAAESPEQLLTDRTAYINQCSFC